MINNVIHQTWRDNNLSSYSDGKIAFQSQTSWVENHPDYLYKLWTDEDIIRLIKSPKYSWIFDAYQRLDQNIKKVDLGRYIILYEFGGIYSDLDFICNQRIPSHILSNNDFVGYKAPRGHLGLHKQKLNTIDRGQKSAWVLGQAFFCCSKNYPPLFTLIKNIVEDCDSSEDPLEHTGPEKIHTIMIQEDTLFNEKTYIFDSNRVGNGCGEIGFHLRRHQWSKPNTSQSIYRKVKQIKDLIYKK